MNILTSRAILDGIFCSGSYVFRKLDVNLVAERGMPSYSKYLISLEFIYLGSHYQTHSASFFTHRM